MSNTLQQTEPDYLSYLENTLKGEETNRLSYIEKCDKCEQPFRFWQDIKQPMFFVTCPLCGEKTRLCKACVSLTNHQCDHVLFDGDDADVCYRAGLNYDQEHTKKYDVSLSISYIDEAMDLEDSQKFRKFLDASGYNLDSNLPTYQFSDVWEKQVGDSYKNKDGITMRRFHRKATLHLIVGTKKNESVTDKLESTMRTVRKTISSEHAPIERFTWNIIDVKERAFLDTTVVTEHTVPVTF